MASSITKAELERLRRIEQLAREAVKPNPPEKHHEALAALRKALTDADPPSDRDVSRGAVTQQIFPKDG
jgi:hypothetical protein